MKKVVFAVIAFFVASSFAFARLNVNTATQAELEALKDLGPVKAKLIVDYRQKHGDFKTLKDLKKVPGVGASTIDKIKREVTVHKPEYMQKNRIHKHPKP
jgi:competence protein ComEA